MSSADPDLFLRACGDGGPLVVGITPSGQGGVAHMEPRVIAQPYLVVGRLPTADVCLDDPQVSRRHAYIQLLGGRLYGVDLGSRTGTFHRNRRVDAGWIGPGQDVQIGPFGLRFLNGSGCGGEDEGPDPLNSALRHDGSELPPLRFEVNAPGIPPRVWRMAGTLALVGRGALCRLALRGQRIGLYHCSLVRTHEGLWAVDLLTEWGTEHNGAVVRSCRLVPGDRLGVGPFSIRLLEPQQSVRSTSEPEAIRSAGTALRTADEHAHASINADGTHAFPAAASLETTSRLTALPWDPDGRLAALEQRQEMMQDQFQQAILLILKAFGGMHREQMEVLTAELNEVRRLTESIDGLREELLRKPADVPGARPAEKPADAATVPPIPNGPEPPPWFNPDLCNLESPRVRRDPREVHAFVSERLEAFERERQSRWNRILRTLTGTS